MFAKRTAWNLAPNPLSEALDDLAARAAPKQDRNPVRRLEILEDVLGY